MSREYDLYLEQHKENVGNGYRWLCVELPELTEGVENLEWYICSAHDASKSDPEEYGAYDAYFYGNRSYEVVRNFERAWLRHIHNNPHHWQHWILNNDDPGEGMVILDMDYTYIIEMICDWWAFSWKDGNLREIFSWYNERKDYMKLSEKTRKTVNDILDKISKKLDEKGM